MTASKTSRLGVHPLECGVLLANPRALTAQYCQLTLTLALRLAQRFSMQYQVN